VDILPYDEVDFSRVLDALATRGFIVKYGSENREFGHIPSWHRHQVVNNRETASILPQPSEFMAVSDACSTRAPRDDHAGKAERKGKEGKVYSPFASETDDAAGKKVRTTYPEAFESFWSIYPKNPNMAKKEAFDAWKRLDDDEREQCIRAIPGYVAYLKTKPTLETIHACRFISKRKFEGFTNVPGSSPAVVDDERWLKRLKHGRREGAWSSSWGPRPGEPGSLVPPALLETGDGADWKEMEVAA
jgi:hypothetical protein